MVDGRQGRVLCSPVTVNQLSDTPPLAELLRDVFGFTALRPGQREVIEDVLAGVPVIGVMPTGAGKSLCYQLPAVQLAQRGGVTLVVSPLIALMKDQVDALRARGVSTAALTSAASAVEQSEILSGIRSAIYDLVYVAPERFRSPRFLDALDATGDRLALLAIDEAHCISEWGHEFRPAYRMLGEALRRLRPPRVVALTATATPEVRQDICAQLGFHQAAFHVYGFARPNLKLSVEPTGGVSDKSSRILAHVQRRDGGVALVYAATRKNAEAYAAAIDAAGLRVAVYHAGLEDDARRRAQEAFMADHLDAIVATNAFGMGVDKADVRVVVHADLPRSPEAYYQEAGRAGRDGADAQCVLLFNHGDVRLQEFLIDASYPSAAVLRGVWAQLRGRSVVASQVEELRELLPEKPHGSVVRSALRILQRHGYAREQGDLCVASQPSDLGGEFPAFDPEQFARRAEAERRKLRSMVEYGYDGSCRHRFFLSYFGDLEACSSASCDACDNCTGLGNSAAMTEEQADQVRLLLGVVSVLSGRFGRMRLAAVANGTDTDERLNALAERGCLRGQSKSYLMDLLRALEGAGEIRSTGGDYPTLAITAHGKRVLAGQVELAQLRVPAPKQRNGKRLHRAIPLGPPDAIAMERLKTLRSHLASEHSVPAYRIFSNRTLEELARAQPATLEELSRVHGIGPGRLQTYGSQILQALAG